MRKVSRLGIFLKTDNLGQTIKKAIEVDKNGADFLLMNSALIKKYGIQNVLDSVKDVIHCPIFLETQILDRGKKEAANALKKGSDGITVLGMASRPTITKVLEMAKRYSGKVILDLLGLEFTRDKIEIATNMDVDLILARAGSDQQESGRTVLDVLERMPTIEKNKLAVMGGIKKENFYDVLDYNPEVVIVGDFVLESKDAGKSVEELKDIMRRKGRL